MNTRLVSFILVLTVVATACTSPSQFSSGQQAPDGRVPALKSTSTPTAEPSSTPTATESPPTATATPRPPTSTPTQVIPMARVMAAANIRKGACNQPIITSASTDMEFPVTGRYITASGEVWWQIQIPAGNGALMDGWIWGDLVKVTHDTLVPSVDSQCPPFATATPSVVIKFVVEPNEIALGQCATLAWRVEGVKEVYLWDGFEYYDVTDLKAYAYKVCPEYTTDYSLEITLPNNDVLIRTITLYVTP